MGGPHIPPPIILALPLEDELEEELEEPEDGLVEVPLDEVEYVLSIIFSPSTRPVSTSTFVPSSSPTVISLCSVRPHCPATCTYFFLLVVVIERSGIVSTLVFSESVIVTVWVMPE